MSAQDVISVTPQSFTLQANLGENVPTQTANVRKLKSGVVRVNVSSAPDKPWLRVSPTSGQNNLPLLFKRFVQTETQKLPPGITQHASFRVVSGTTSILVTVQLTMIAVAPTLAVGPQSWITCPTGSPETVRVVDVWPGDPIQLFVDSNLGDTTFCLRAGVHQLTSSIRPKTGNTFVGEFGAILDGTGWTTTDGTQGAFRAHNEDIDYVKIRNLVIRNMPQRGIQAFYWMSDHWTIEYNEIAFNKYGHRVRARLHHQEQLHPPQHGHSWSPSGRSGRRLRGALGP